VVIDDLNVFRADLQPEKAEPLLVVDRLDIDGIPVLAGPIAPQRLQTVARQNSHILQTLGDLQLPQLVASHQPEDLEAWHGPTSRKGIGVGACSARARKRRFSRASKSGAAGGRRLSRDRSRCSGKTGAAKLFKARHLAYFMQRTYRCDTSSAPPKSPAVAGSRPVDHRGLAIAMRQPKNSPT
jgi:hypothetical protein